MPEDASDSLLIILGLMTESIERYRGTIVQVMGDGILAIFGAPQALEDHATRACLAAEHIHEQLQNSLARFPGLANQPPTFVRIGINSGEVLIKPTSGQSLTDYQIISESVHIAQRLQSGADPGTTHLGQETVRILGSSIRVVEKKPLQLTTESSMLHTYKLRHIASVKRPSVYNNSFVGRVAELKQLAAMLESCEQGTGQHFCIVGEAGIGKSRLVYEFKRTLPPLSWLVIEYLLDNLPGHPLRFLQEIWKIFVPSPTRDVDDMRKAIQQLLQRLGIKEVFGPSALLSLMGLRVDDRAWDSLGAEEKLAITSASLAQIVVATSRQQPVLLIIEDYQWVATDVVSFLADLVPRVTDSRVLLLITHRAIDRFESPFNLPLIPLSSLSPTESRYIVDWFFGPYPDLEEMKDKLLDKTQGNPLFLLESMEIMAQKGYIEGSLGNYRLGKSYFSFAVPPTVQGILAERIDSLPPLEREVLSTASVMGAQFFYLLLAHLMKQPLSDIQPLLNHLEQAGFIVPEPLIPGKSPSSCFRHNLMQDVSYNSLLKKNRRYLHQQSIVALEGKLGRKIDQRWQQLAHHTLIAEDWRKAYLYNRRAAHNVFIRGANREAIDFYRGSLMALRQMQAIDPSPAIATRIIDVNLSLVKPYFTTGNWTQVNNVLAETLRDSRKLNNPLKELETRTFYILLEWIKGDYEKAIGISTKLLHDDQKILTQELKIRILTRLAGIYFDMGELSKSFEIYQYILKYLESGFYKYKKFGLLTICSVTTYTQIGQIYAEKGNFELAASYGKEAISIASSSPDILTQIYASFRVAGIFLKKEDFSNALSLLEKGFELCTQSRSKLFSGRITNALIYAYAKLGQQQEASFYLLEGLKNYHHKSSDNYLGRYLSWLGESLYILGDKKLAEEVARDIIAKSQQYKEIINLAWGQCLLARVLIDTQELEEAVILLNKIKFIAKKYQLLPLMAEYYKLSAQLAHTENNQAKFNHYRQKANQLFEEMQIKDTV
jgi:tetratricopeptide (TPR) repeat protein